MSDQEVPEIPVKRIPVTQRTFLLPRPCESFRDFLSSDFPVHRLVPGLEELESQSSKSDSSPSDAEDDDNRSITPQNVILQPAHLQATTTTTTTSIPRLDGGTLSNSEDDEIGDGLRTFHHHPHPHQHHHPLPQAILTGDNNGTGKGEIVPPTPFSPSHSSSTTVTSGQKLTNGGGGVPGLTVERRRRKLPEIPKNKKRKFSSTRKQNH